MPRPFDPTRHHHKIHRSERCRNSGTYGTFEHRTLQHLPHPSLVGQEIRDVLRIFFPHPVTSVHRIDFPNPLRHPQPRTICFRSHSARTPDLIIRNYYRVDHSTSKMTPGQLNRIPLYREFREVAGSDNEAHPGLFHGGEVVPILARGRGKDGDDRLFRSPPPSGAPPTPSP